MSLATRFVDYFRARRWLTVWLGIFAVAILLLWASGALHTQGNGLPTWMEWSVIGVAIAIWIVSAYAFENDLTEEYLMGILFGIQWEFLTEPYWTYQPDKFNILAWKDVPLIGIVGWGTNFAMVLLFSNWIGRKLFKMSPAQLIFDWRVLLCDAIAIQVIGSLAEWMYGIVLAGWTYDMPFGLGTSPLGLGWEVHVGYMIVFFWYGTTMRVWKHKLEGSLPGNDGSGNLPHSDTH